ncbi:MAG: DNA internalization-related competence protein ComEC/Rec2 [Candidatus Omnitrophica bacterium]|nr:DNA internalization-related competence protein ComEC/Rec2 [Candidatus Omnitrophota bacterium]
MKRPVFYITIVFCLSLLTARLVVLPAFYSLILSALFLSGSILLSRRAGVSHVFLYLGVLFFGMAYYQNFNILPADHISNLISEEPQKVVVAGIIIDDPVTDKTYYGTRTRFKLEVDSIEYGIRSRASIGRVAVTDYSRNGARFVYGDRVLLEGMISKPSALKNPGLFDYSKYLETQKVYGVVKVKDGSSVRLEGRVKSQPVKKLAYSLRQKARSIIDRYIDQPYNGFIKAILIGDRMGLEHDIKDNFIKTGTIHVLAISGLHVGLIAALVFIFFTLFRLPRKASFVLTAVTLIVYLFIAGSSLPVIRAVIMFALTIIAYAIGRQADLLNSISVAAFLMLLWNPKALFDPAFQLSSLSVLSIAAITPKVNAILKIGPKPSMYFTGRMKSYILTGLSVSIAAWLGTWPLVAKYFNILSPISVLVNLAVIPLIFVLIVSAFLFLVAAPISVVLASLFASALEALARILFSVNDFFAGLPVAHFRVPAPTGWIIVSYYTILLLWIMPSPLLVWRFHIDKRKVLIAILVAMNIGFWRDVAISASESRNMRITFLDVEQGDSAFLEFPGGNLLIDGGSGGEEGALDIGRSVVAPFLWNRGFTYIDSVVVTHMHEDHMGGIIYLLNNFKVNNIIDNGIVPEDRRLYNAYLEAIRKNGSRHVALAAGDSIEYGGAVTVSVLNPESWAETDQNNGSLVLKVGYKNFNALFCGDIKSDAMKKILEARCDALKSDIIKVPHHGGNLGDEETVKKFFSAVSPKNSIISVGRSNRYKMPSGNTLEIINHLNSNTYITKDDGAIIVRITPESYKIGSYINRN